MFQCMQLAPGSRQLLKNMKGDGNQSFIELFNFCPPEAALQGAPLQDLLVRHADFLSIPAVLHPAALLSSFYLLRSILSRVSLRWNFGSLSASTYEG